MGALFWLADEGAPARVRRSLRAIFGIQVVVAAVVALIRPFTPLAFGTLAPDLRPRRHRPVGRPPAEFPPQGGRARA